VVIYSVPLHLQIVNGKSPLMAGLGLLPLLAATAIGSMLGGAISSKNDLSFYTLTAGSGLLALGTGLLSTISSSTKVDPMIYGFEIFVGLGFGLSVSTASILAAIQCEIKDHGMITFPSSCWSNIFLATAQGMVAQARVLGGSFGIAASTAILGLFESRELADIISPSQLSALNFGSLNTAQAQSVRQTYAHAFNHTLRVCTIMSGISILCALLAWQKNPPTLAERTEQQLKVEIERQKQIAMAKMRSMPDGQGGHRNGGRFPTREEKSG
jgi:hypothetical protein